LHFTLEFARLLFPRERHLHHNRTPAPAIFSSSFSAISLLFTDPLPKKECVFLQFLKNLFYLQKALLHIYFFISAEH
jgi:hypothetical protein